MDSFLRLALLLLLSANAHGETRFLRPPDSGPTRDYRDNPIYEIGQKLDIQWEMDYENASIIVQQEDAYNNLPGDKWADIITNAEAVPDRTNFTWTVSLNNFSDGFDKTLSNVYYLRLFDISGKVGGIDSHYFNITSSDSSNTEDAAPTRSADDSSNQSAESSATTSAESSTTASAASTKTPSSSSGGQSDKSASSTASSDSNGNDDKSPSKGALVGIAVAATVGGLGLLAGIGFFIRKHLRKRRENQGTLISPEEPKQEDSTTGTLTPSVLASRMDQDYYQRLPHTQYPLHELHGQQSRIHEAPS
ncbi:hypothetical protein G7Z17_g1457 [Cylindrodendrum hubeiense]|uniref:Mid2 domain-containing protein n=1 Tax=Cylindrodendrum hubeiense TaxID=595255 RepID=A0A9P5LLC3_9HYPO|nr:hypothetical protein G7Z17_g1457 [Cylindrodendrum hubeiense]